MTSHARFNRWVFAVLAVLCPRPAPAACANFPGVTTATDAGGCFVDVTWQGALIPGTYSVRRDSLCPPTLDSAIIATGLTGTSYRDRVAPGRSYCYVVEVNAGTLCLNQPSPVLTPACAPAVLPEVENADLRCESGALVASWDAVPGATGYNLYRGSLTNLQMQIYDHTNFGACNIGGTSYIFPGDCTTATATYYIVVARLGAIEGDYGYIDSTVIPPAVTVCP